MKAFALFFGAAILVMVAGSEIIKAAIPLGRPEFNSVPVGERHLKCVYRPNFNTYLSVVGGDHEVELKDIDCQYIAAELCFPKPEKCGAKPEKK
jgi:hypothetical protein